jgi:hypothetical protein
MFTRIRKRFTYANVALTVALLFAMSGGAYAAGKYLITSTKQISPKVLKSLKGANGKAGATGPQGPAGPAGATGPQGPAGGSGQKGEKGERGEKGETGAAGQNGTTGFTETLPSGKTEKGDWAMTGAMPGTGALEGSDATAVSFVIPLKEAPAPVYIHAPSEEQWAKGEFPIPPAGCTGNVTEPGAEPGHVCVFASQEFNANPPFICSSAKPAILCIFGSTGVGGTADDSGFVITTVDKEKGLMTLNGTWAATAE